MSLIGIGMPVDWDWHPAQSLLGISADNVTVDMQGFGVSGALLLVAITGNSATPWKTDA